MSDEQALLAAIWEHPHDDTVRLAYADWLDEHGQGPRAELVRVQCELATLAGDDPRYDALEARAAELLCTWEKEWWQAMPAGAKRGSHFDRGFPVPSLGQFSIPGLVKLGEKRLRAAPLWRYHYGVRGESLGALLGWPCLHRLELFALRPPLADGWADRLAGCASLRNTTDLSLLDCPVSAGEVSLLLDAWAARPLSHFAADLDAAGCAAVAAHPTAAKLRSLRLESCGLTADGLRALIGGPHLTGLHHVSLGYNGFGDEGLAVLLRWPGLRALRWLSLGNTRITTAGVELLAACPAAANLRTLWLSSNPIGLPGARAVVESPHLANLKRVPFYDTPAVRDPATEAALRRRFGRGNY